MDIKAMFFDVDGTLLSFETHKMPESTLYALHELRKKGVKLFLGTGRHPAMLKGLMEAFPFDGMVALTGVYCTIGEEVIRSIPLSRPDMERYVTALREHHFPCVYLADGEIFIHEPHPDVDWFFESLDLPDPVCRPIEYALETPVYQVVVFLDKENEHKLFDVCPGMNHTRWNPRFLDLICPEGGKDVGLQVVMDRLGITREEVMAFGDGENDLSMIRHAGIGVVMGSGTEYLKSQADYVTGTPDEDGIYTALKHFGIL